MSICTTPAPAEPSCAPAKSTIWKLTEFSSAKLRGTRAGCGQSIDCGRRNRGQFFRRQTTVLSAANRRRQQRKRRRRRRPGVVGDRVGRIGKAADRHAVVGSRQRRVARLRHPQARAGRLVELQRDVEVEKRRRLGAVQIVAGDVDPHVVLGDARSVADVDQQAGAESAGDRPGVVGDRGVDIDDIVVDGRVVPA